MRRRGKCTGAYSRRLWAFSPKSLYDAGGLTTSSFRKLYFQKNWIGGTSLVSPLPYFCHRMTLCPASSIDFFRKLSLALSFFLNSSSVFGLNLTVPENLTFGTPRNFKILSNAFCSFINKSFFKRSPPLNVLILLFSIISSQILPNKLYVNLFICTLTLA